MKKFIITFITIFPLALFSATKEKVTMPDSKKVEGRNLSLNGMGIRKATIFGIKVYVGGLYTETKSKEFTMLIDQPGPKQIVMHFVRDVDKDKLNNGWQEGFERAVKNTKFIQNQIDEFKSLMQDMKDGQEIVITFLKDKVNLNINNGPVKQIKGRSFARALFSVWFINPVDEGLKNGLLGL